MSSQDSSSQLGGQDRSDTKSWSIPVTILIGFAGFIMSNAVAFVIAVIGLKLFGGDYSKNIFFNFGLLIMSDLAFLSVIFWYLRSANMGPEDLGLLKRIKTSNILLVIATGLAYVVLTAVLSLLVKILFPSIDLTQEQAIAFTKAIGPIEKVFAAVALLVIAPIAEELIFRGFVFRGFRKQLGFFGAAVVSSIFFGLIHGQINVALDTFALGMMLCYLYEKTESIWPSIMLHSLKNGIAFYLLFFTTISALW